jgi:hypothetical protein
MGHVQLLLDDPAISDPEVTATLRIVEGELRRLAKILGQLGAIGDPSGATPAD